MTWKDCNPAERTKIPNIRQKATNNKEDVKESGDNNISTPLHPLFNVSDKVFLSCENESYDMDLRSFNPIWTQQEGHSCLKPISCLDVCPSQTSNYLRLQCRCK